MSLFSIKRGFSVVEIVIGAAVVALVVTGIASAWQFYTVMSVQTTRYTQAALLLEEGGEIIQYLRDKGWAAQIANKALNTQYFLIWYNNDYQATTTATLINGSYSRTVAFGQIRRDGSANIVTNGGTVDPDSLTATIRIYNNLSTTTAPILTGQMLVHNTYDN
jgi:Tfp pilus assembly protein PilE